MLLTFTALAVVPPLRIMFPLLQLPAELRLIVYSSVHEQGPPSTYRGLLLFCKKVYDEAYQRW